MKPLIDILHYTDTEKWISERGWIGLAGRRIVPKVPAVIFHGGYDLSGSVAANMLEIFLTELSQSPISSGFLSISNVAPMDKASTDVFNLIQGVFSGRDIPHPGNISFICYKYEILLAMLSWCLACGWEVNFISISTRLAFNCDDDCNVSIFWPKDVVVRESGIAALVNNGYRPETGQTEKGQKPFN